MVGRGDDYGIDAFVFEQLALILVLGGRGAGFADREVQIVVAKIANACGYIVAVFKKCVVNLVAAIAEPDVSHADDRWRREFGNSLGQ
jgi:hypothetical protein